MDIGRVSHSHARQPGLRLVFLSSLSPFQRLSRTSYRASSGWPWGRRASARAAPCAALRCPARGRRGAVTSQLHKRTCGKSFFRVRLVSARVPTWAVVAFSSLSRPTTSTAASRPLPARRDPRPSSPATQLPDAGTSENFVTIRSRRTAGLSPRCQTEVAVQTEGLSGVLAPQVRGLAATTTHRLLSRAGHWGCTGPEREAGRGLGARTKPAGPCDWSPAALHPPLSPGPGPRGAGTGRGTPSARRARGAGKSGELKANICVHNAPSEAHSCRNKGKKERSGGDLVTCR